jgi:L-alanine-DL-glutamate epimerase-like enolase superfamily enzyme
VPLSLRGGAGLARVVEELEAAGRERVFEAFAAERLNLPGEDPPSLDLEWECDDFWEGRLSLPARCAAVTALLDLRERQQATLTGPPGGTIASSVGRHDPGPVPCNATLVAGDPAKVARDALRWAEDGFRTFKLKLGTGEEVTQVEAVREAVGPGRKLRVDANGAWSLEEAKRILAELERFEIELVEQPVANTEDAVELARVTEIPLAGDESIVSKDDATRATESGAFAATGIKVSKVGGIGPGMEIATVLRAYVASALDGPVGIAAGGRLAQRLHYEYPGPDRPPLAHGLATQRLFASTIAAVECELRGDMLHAPEGPGLGVEIDEAALDAHRL